MATLHLLDGTTREIQPRNGKWFTRAEIAHLTAAGDGLTQTTAEQDAARAEDRLARDIDADQWGA